MKPRKIIIVTDEYDLDADAVILRLREMGQLPARLNLRDVPSEASFSIILDKADQTGRLRTRNREIDLNDIGSIFWRKSAWNELPKGFSEKEQEFAQTEIDHALNGLWTSLDCYWMSHPRNIREAKWKLGQLKRAAELGFEIPRTLITSQPNQAEAFFEQCNRKIVFKVMGERVLWDVEKPSVENVRPSAIAIYPALVNEEDLKKHLDKIANTPCLFQEYVSKKFDLRVTIVGDDVFVAQIESEQPLRKPLDKQGNDPHLVLRKMTLPDELEERCMALTKRFGLNYSVIDLALTTDGRYVFLELNPEGRFLPVQEHLRDLKIADAIAACLLRGENGASMARET